MNTKDFDLTALNFFTRAKRENELKICNEIVELRRTRETCLADATLGAMRELGIEVTPHDELKVLKRRKQDFDMWREKTERRIGNDSDLARLAAFKVDKRFIKHVVAPHGLQVEEISAADLSDVLRLKQVDQSVLVSMLWENPHIKGNYAQHVVHLTEPKQLFNDAGVAYKCSDNQVHNPEALQRGLKKSLDLTGRNGWLLKRR